MLEYDKMYLIVAKRKPLSKDALEYYLGFLQDVFGDTFHIAHFDLSYFKGTRISYIDLTEEDLEYYEITELPELNEQVISFRESLNNFKNVSETYKQKIIEERGLE